MTNLSLLYPIMNAVTLEEATKECGGLPQAWKEKIGYNQQKISKLDEFKGLLGKVVFEIFKQDCQQEYGKKSKDYKKIRAFSKDVEGKKLRVEVAILSAMQHPEWLASTIDAFNIDDQEALARIARVCMGQKGEWIAPGIKNFGIRDPKVRSELAKLCAEKNPGEVACCIEDFAIESQDDLFEVAKICAERAGDLTARFIKDFGIQDEKKRLELATLCIRQDACSGKWIREFEISSEKDRIELAKLCGSKPSGKLPVIIDRFDIQDQTTLLHMAMLIAVEDPVLLLENLRKFGIKDQTSLIALAKMCAQKTTYYTGKHIQDFCITDQKALIEIAKLCAQPDEYFPKRCDLKNFKITDKAALVELVILFAEKEALGIAEAIADLGITEEKDVVRIVTAAAKNNGAYVATHITSFKITNESALIEIAKICARENPSQLTGYIRNFGIQNDEGLAEIAKVVGEESLQVAICCIKNFAIKSEEIRIKLTRHFILRDMRTTALMIANFGISDQTTLIEFATFCAERWGYVRHLLSKFGIQDGDVIKKLHLLCLIHHYTAHVNQSEFIREAENVLPLCDEKTILDLFKEAAKGVDANDKFHAYVSAMYQWRYLLEGKGKLEKRDQEIFSEICEYRNRPIVKELIEIFSKIASNSTLKSCYYSSATNKYQRLLLLPLASWASSSDAIKLVIDSEKREAFKSAATGLLQSWLLAAIEINKTKVNHQQRIELFQRACCSGENSDFTKIIALTQIAPAALEGSFSNNISKELSLLMEERIQAYDYVNLQNIDGFMKRYDETWGSTRVSLAWLTYGRGLRTTNDTAVQKEYEAMVRSILLGKHLDERYRTDNNPHLAKLKEKFPDAFKAWQKGSRETIIIKNEKKEREEYDLVDTDNWQDLFLSGSEVVSSCMKVDGVPDLNKCLLSVVMDGKYRLVAICEKGTGKILIRARLSILFDQYEKPILFLDKFYSGSLEGDVYEKTLINLAIRKAEELNLSLVTYSEDPLPGFVTSLGSRSPYNYEDSLGLGVIKGGSYRIDSLKVLHQRSSSPAIPMLSPKEEKEEKTRG